MSKYFICIVGALMLACHWFLGGSFALENPDTGPGCGLGKKLWNDWKGQKQIAPQVFMASTNVTGSYTFALTSGTSGCSNDGTIWDSQKASLFIELNYASLKEDMARGGGEHLASLATLMHVPVERQPQFFAAAQAKYVSWGELGEDNPAAIERMLSGAMAGEAVEDEVAVHP